MAGRRPTPDALKDLAGNPGKRKRVKRPPALPAGEAAMPKMVQDDPIARGEWRRLAPKLKLLGLIDDTNQDTFASYCVNHALERRAKEQLQKEGITYRTAGGQIKKHPAFEIMRQAGAEKRKFALEHGITPASRTRAQPTLPTQPSLPGMPEKPDAPHLPADDNEKFFAGRSPVH